eukprot:209004-Pelagomonas_calceolata.AAC.1
MNLQQGMLFGDVQGQDLEPLVSHPTGTGILVEPTRRGRKSNFKLACALPWPALLTGLSFSRKANPHEFLTSAQDTAMQLLKGLCGPASKLKASA